MLQASGNRPCELAPCCTVRLEQSSWASSGESPRRRSVSGPGRSTVDSTRAPSWRMCLLGVLGANCAAGAAAS